MADGSALLERVIEPQVHTTFPLGPFELDQPLGSGGMGEVWRGTHRSEGVPVAVKVIAKEHTEKPRFLELFQNEVLAVARLTHPGIVMVLDHGAVSHESAEASGGRISEGSPYLVMEMLSGGTIGGTQRPADWSTMRRTMLEVLDALAYAHARGVLHLDLKPNNLMLGGDDDLRPGLKLIDFGLAEVARLDQVEHGAMMGGTPGYQAPEQVVSWRRRDRGPWTDLYSLGCSAYRLVTGQPPYSGDSADEIVKAHLITPLPPMVPLYDVPEGFSGWVERLMAKDISRRFMRAADAAHALEHLDSRDWLPAHEALWHSLTPESVATVVTQADTPQLQIDVTPWEELPVVPRHRDLSSLPRVPSSWKRPAAPFPAKLHGAGLGLFGLRQATFVGRDRERDQVWRCLHAVHEQDSARAVLVRGPVGVGKSRFVEWISERAHEVGAADVLQAVHHRSPHEADGLGPMVGRFLNTTGLSGIRLHERLERRLTECGARDSYEWRGLAELIQPSKLDGEEGTVRFHKPAERHALLYRVLRRIGNRPLLVWIDDASRTADGLRFVLHSLRAQAETPHPILFVVTTREGTPTTSVVGELMASLGEHERAEECALEPLTILQHGKLLDSLLGLEPSLRTRLAERAGGTPLFAVQLLADWVRSGRLQPGEDGFYTDGSEAGSLPDDIHQVWLDRIRHLSEATVPEAPERVGLCLEVAAALGEVVQREEWELCCQRIGYSVPTGLVESLLRSHLATPTDRGYQFAHGLFVESLEREAKDHSRWEGINAGCADVLRRLTGDGVPQNGDRIGRHLVNAGQIETGIDFLLAAVEYATARSDYDKAHEQLDWVAQVLATALPSQKVAVWLHRSAVRLLEGDFDGAERDARRGVAEATQNGALLPNAQFRLGDVLKDRGRLEEGSSLMTEALGGLRSGTHQRTLARCLISLGYVSMKQGNLRKAKARLEEGFRHASDIPDNNLAAYALRGWAATTRIQGDLNRAAELTAQSLSLYRRVGSHFGIGAALNGLGEVERARDRLVEAEAYYREALEVYRSIGSASPGIDIFPRMNLALVLLLRDHIEAASTEVEQLAHLCQQLGLRGVLTGVRALQMACCAGAQRWDQWESRLLAYNELQKDIKLVEPDLAVVFEKAAYWARSGGENKVAEASLALALDMWRRLGDGLGVARVEGDLERLPS